MFESAATWWWVVAGLLVAAELATGTFYLLMLALGMAAGAVTAHGGGGLTAQVALAALIAAGATTAWYLRRRRDRPFELASHENPNVNIDIGELVHVDAWAGDRTSRVNYRGSTWSARLAPDALPIPGQHRVAAVAGNWLVLVPTAVVA